MGWANECIECGISVTNGSKCQKERSWEGGKLPNTNRNQQALSAPPLVQNLYSLEVSWRAWNLRGRAQGLVGFGLCLIACPLPYCALNCGLCLGRLPIPYALSDSSVSVRLPLCQLLIRASAIDNRECFS